MHRLVSFTVAGCGLSVAFLAGCSGGTGTVNTNMAAPAVSLSANSVSLSASVGLTASQALTLTNSGTAALALSSFAVTGANASLFSQTNTCGTSVAAQGSCVVTVVFAPTASGAFSATLTLADNAGNGMQTVGLSGTGLVLAPASATVDCSVSSTTCGGNLFPGQYGELPSDMIAAGGFHGYADPSMRKDPNTTSTIYLAYSWAKSLLDGTHVVDLHLASSTDSGKTWTYVGPLYQSVQTTQTQSTAYSSVNDSSTETVDLLPIPLTGASAGQTLWVQAHQSYLVAPQGGIYDQLNATNIISVSALQLASPAAGGAGTALLGLATAPEARLAAVSTDASRTITQRVSSLSTSTSKCGNWGQPTLWYQSGTLYLALECTEISGTGQLDGNELGHFVYSTTPTGTDASKWTWAYVGEFATEAQAAKLSTAEGSTAYTFFTEPEFVSLKSGGLAVILTPGVFSTGQQPVIQYGCRVVPVTLTPTSVTLSIDPTTQSPVVLAKITEADLYSGVDEGPAACTYEPASVNGIVMGRKYENDANPPNGFYIYPLATGVMP